MLMVNYKLFAFQGHEETEP